VVAASSDSVVIRRAAQIVTMDPRNPSATAVATRGSRIVAVGSLDEVRAALGDVEGVIDDTHLNDVILPGLIDQHLHPILGASTLATEVVAPEDWVLPDRTFPAAGDERGYRTALSAALANTDETGWLFSWGYHKLWHGELSRDILDEISDTVPIGIWQRSCHEFYVNSAAVKRLGLTDDTLPGDTAIRATIDLERGHFWERGFFVGLFPLLMPTLFSAERLSRGLRQMVDYLHQNGVTAFNEPGAILVPGAWDLYQEILGADGTPFYSYFLTDGRGPAEAGLNHEDTLARAARDHARAPEGKVSFFDKQVKLFADGAIISQLMQMREPYLDRAGNPDPHHHGEWIMPPEVFRERAELYWDAGFQIHIHVNGDLGLDLVLDTLEAQMARNPRPNHRSVIVHFANSTEEQIDRIARLGAVVSGNPYYPVGFSDKFGEVGLGRRRADVMVRSASVLQRRIPLSFHSDLPMGPCDPLAMVSFAVNRTTPSGRVAGPEQRINATEALAAVTIGAAQSWQQEHELGSITPGKIANFTVVDANPLDVKPESIDDVHVIGTVFEGRWFPVGAGRSRVANRRRQPAGSSSPGLAADVDGCVCSVAHQVARAVADHLHRSRDVA